MSSAAASGTARALAKSHQPANRALANRAYKLRMKLLRREFIKHHTRYQQYRAEVLGITSDFTAKIHYIVDFEHLVGKALLNDRQQAAFAQLLNRNQRCAGTDRVMELGAKALEHY